MGKEWLWCRICMDRQYHERTELGWTCTSCGVLNKCSKTVDRIVAERERHRQELSAKLLKGEQLDG